ncbi:Chromate resistance protein ChrB [Microbacterium sp. GXS0129]|uniref:Chromate resistance protein ChrB n=1 Tax=Microbacterium sp. GXS0129 TaxID=3377836 RepID=UPI00383A2BEF
MQHEVAWLFALVQIPAEPSRHRVAVWRELKRAGAVTIAQGTWALPDASRSRAALDRAGELASEGGGHVAVFAVDAQNEAARTVVAELYRDARVEEWREFDADCGKFEAEIASEIAKEKFTFAELEEEEQSLDRLRRWYRDLKRRDVLGLAEAEASAEHLRACERALERFADLVYAADRTA